MAEPKLRKTMVWRARGAEGRKYEAEPERASDGGQTWWVTTDDDKAVVYDQRQDERPFHIYHPDGRRMRSRDDAQETIDAYETRAAARNRTEEQKRRAGRKPENAE